MERDGYLIAKSQVAIGTIGKNGYVELCCNGIKTDDHSRKMRNLTTSSSSPILKSSILIPTPAVPGLLIL
jgi:succinyl-CoA synthetase beta subunit